jgi:hypothetical protein
MTSQTSPENEAQADLPVHFGDVPPEEQVRGMASPEDLESVNTEEETE